MGVNVKMRIHYVCIICACMYACAAVRTKVSLFNPAQTTHHISFGQLVFFAAGKLKAYRRPMWQPFVLPNQDRICLCSSVSYLIFAFGCLLFVCVFAFRFWLLIG